MTPKCGWILFLVLFVPNYIETGEYSLSLFLYLSFALSPFFTSVYFCALCVSTKRCIVQQMECFDLLRFMCKQIKMLKMLQILALSSEWTLEMLYLQCNFQMPYIFCNSLLTFILSLTLSLPNSFKYASI